MLLGRASSRMTCLLYSAQAYGKELGEAWECTEKYKKTKRETELHQVHATCLQPCTGSLLRRHQAHACRCPAAL